MDLPLPPFLFVICQAGAEAALKHELRGLWPDLRLAFSRPGFLTFKRAPDSAIRADTDLRSVFARTWGFSLGHVTGRTPEDVAAEVWRLAGPQRYRHLHVWARDTAPPGEHGFELGLTAAVMEAGQRLAAQQPGVAAGAKPLAVNLLARSGELVLDCVQVEPDQWWVGFHRATTLPTRWPGGVPKLDLPPHAVSRAYRKMNEALLWSGFPITSGDRCVEIGSAPGGACQALLDRGLLVTGIDPAEMHPEVAAHPHFTHLRARGADLKRREFRGVKWLIVDSNVAPSHTLDTVEHIVTHRQVNVRGLLLTLKLLEWELAEAIPAYLERIRGWGYEYVRARQLAFNRQEICVAALRRRAWRRTPRGKTRHG